MLMVERPSLAIFQERFEDLLPFSYSNHVFPLTLLLELSVAVNFTGRGHCMVFFASSTSKVSIATVRASILSGHDVH